MNNRIKIIGKKLKGDKTLARSEQESRDFQFKTNYIDCKIFAFFADFDDILMVVFSETGNAVLIHFVPNIDHGFVIVFHLGPCGEELSQAFVEYALPEAHCRLQEHIGDQPEDQVSVFEGGHDALGLSYLYR